MLRDRIWPVPSHSCLQPEFPFIFNIFPKVDEDVCHTCYRMYLWSTFDQNFWEHRPTIQEKWILVSCIYLDSHTVKCIVVLFSQCKANRILTQNQYGLNKTELCQMPVTSFFVLNFGLLNKGSNTDISIAS